MIHKNAEKYLSGFEKINEYFGFDYLTGCAFHDAEVDEIRIVPDNLFMQLWLPYHGEGYTVKLHFSMVNEISLDGNMLPLGGIEIYEQESVPGWCVFGMDGNGGEIHCGKIECVSIEICSEKDESCHVISTKN